jgi:hypothetical protein
MIDGLFVDPVQLNTDPMLINFTDGITGGTLATPEKMYGSPQQQMVGWPAIHLYPLLHDEHWDPVAARDYVAWWLPRSLPGGCGCASHFAEVLKAIPLDCSTPGAMFATSHAWHAAVSERINVNGSHPPMSLDSAAALWSRIAAAGPVAWWRPVPLYPIDPKRKRLVITVAAGPAREWLRITRRRMEMYAESVSADFVALEGSTQGWWGLEKFRVHPFAQAYDRTLFLDADVLVDPNGPDVFDCHPANCVAMHDDWVHLPSRDWLYAERRAVRRCQDWPTSYRDAYNDRRPSCFNSGVVLCDRDNADIWAPPKLPIPTSHCAEQIVIESRLYAMDREVYRMNTHWNWQYWMPGFERFADFAFFLHAANAPNKADRLRRMDAEWKPC